MKSILSNFNISKLGKSQFINGFYYEPLNTNPGYSGKIYYRCLRNNRSYILVHFPKDLPESDEIFIETDHQPQKFYYLTLNKYLNDKVKYNPLILDSNENCILMEDLGDISLFSLIEYNNNELHYYKLVKWLISLQSAEPISIVKTRKLEEKAMYLEVIKFMGDFYADKYVISDLTSLCHYICKNQPETAIHRDFQPKNVIIRYNRPYIIDVQDICLGPANYDLASLLYSQNSVDNETFRNKIAEVWWNKYMYRFMTENNYWKILKMTALQRILKAMGRHYYLYCETKDDKYRVPYEKAKKILVSLLPVIEKDYGYLYEFLCKVMKKI